MADDQAKPSGPDLTQGVAFAELADGGMLAGHVGEEQVLLARVGTEVFAVGGALQPLSRPARRRSAGRRHRALPLASRLLQPAHGRGAACAGLEPDRLLVGRAARRQGLRDGQARRREARAARQARGDSAGADRDRGRRRRGLRGGRDAAAAGLQGQHRHAEQRRCGARRSPQPLQGLPRRQRARGMESRCAATTSIPTTASTSVSRPTSRPSTRAAARWCWPTAARSPTTACCWRPARSRSACRSRRRPAARPHAAQPGRQPGHHRAGQDGAAAPS